MSARLIACDACLRHARVTEAKCPFCGAALPARQPTRGTPVGRFGRAALIVAGTAGATVGGASCGERPVMLADAYGADAYGDSPPPKDVRNDSPCPSGLACELCDTSGYVPTAQKPPGVNVGACTAGDISAFVSACEGPSATTQTCNDWQTTQDAGNCPSCIFTHGSDPFSGPLVCDSSRCQINNAGCVDLVLNQTSQEKHEGGAGSCGDLMSDATGCEQYACSGCNDPACVASAVQNECKTWVDRVTQPGACDTLNGDAAPATASQCFPQSPTDIAAFVNLFCGTGL